MSTDTQSMAQMVPLKDINADAEFNCRGTFSAMDVVDLAGSIEKHGLMQPVVVSRYSPEDAIKFGTTWKLIMGFRRFMAHKVLKKTEILAVVKDIVLNDVEARCMNLAENMQRVELTISQEAAALAPLYASGLSETEVAKKLGMSRGWVQQRFLLLKLPIDVQAEFTSAKLKPAEIRPCYQIYNSGNTDAMYAYIKKLKKSRENGRTGAPVAVPMTVKNVKRKAAPADVFKMMAYLGGTIGYGLHTRTLAWSVGELSLEELFEYIKEYAATINVKYEIPNVEEYNNATGS